MLVTDRNPERNEKTGQFDDHYPDEAFLSAIKQLGGAGTSSIAESVGCDRRTAYIRLSEMKEEGIVVGEKIGGVYLWEIPD